MATSQQMTETYEDIEKGLLPSKKGSLSLPNEQDTASRSNLRQQKRFRRTQGRQKA